MFSRIRQGGGVPVRASVLGLGLWILTASPAPAQVGGPPGDGVPATALAVTGIPTALRDEWTGRSLVRWNPYDPPATGHAGMGDSVLHAWCWEQGVAFEYARHHAVGPGSLGYATSGNGEFGIVPGFYGFGLSFSRGYGYGGDGLGVGANGGYPYYGGPGYPCGGYYYPGPMFVAEGPFGSFTGPPPYPEAYFAPYTAAAATTGSASGTAPFDPFSAPSTEGALPPSSSNLPGPSPLTTFPAQARLGIQDESVVTPDGVRGLKITSVVPTSPADKAGLQTGDVILSVNGYRMEVPGNLVWIIDNEAPKNLLTMIVRKISDGAERPVTVQLPTVPVDTSRPSYLPPAGNGPPPPTQ